MAVRNELEAKAGGEIGDEIGVEVGSTAIFARRPRYCPIIVDLCFEFPI